MKGSFRFIRIPICMTNDYYFYVLCFCDNVIFHTILNDFFKKECSAPILKPLETK